MKKIREDEYIKRFQPEQRPLLVIKEKHNFKGVGKDDIFDKEENKEDYYKITKQTDVIEDE